MFFIVLVTDTIANEVDVISIPGVDEVGIEDVIFISVADGDNVIVPDDNC